MQEHQLQCRSTGFLAFAAKRVTLGKSQTVACDVSTAFLHAEMRDEVYIKLDADTLRMIREEKLAKLATLRR